MGKETIVSKGRGLALEFSTFLCIEIYKCISKNPTTYIYTYLSTQNIVSVTETVRKSGFYFVETRSYYVAWEDLELAL